MTSVLYFAGESDSPIQARSRSNVSWLISPLVLAGVVKTNPLVNAESKAKNRTGACAMPCCRIENTVQFFAFASYRIGMRKWYAHCSIGFTLESFTQSLSCPLRAAISLGP